MSSVEERQGIILQMKELARADSILHIEPFYEGSTEYFCKVLVQDEANTDNKVIRWQWIERIELAPALFDDGPYQPYEGKGKEES